MKSYLKFLSRNKLYTAIEAAGLIVSLAFVILIGNYVWQQYRVACENPVGDRVYAVFGNDRFGLSWWEKAAFEDGLPEAEAVCRISGQYNELARIGELRTEAAYRLVDDNLFQLLPELELTAGSLEEFSLQGHCLVSETFANTHFAGDPIGRELEVGIGNFRFGSEGVMTVCGVFRDSDNTMLSKNDVLLNAAYSSFYADREPYSTYGQFVPLIRVRAGTDREALTAKICQICRAHYNEKQIPAFEVLRFDELYFYEGQSFFRRGNATVLSLLMVVVLLLLVSAIFNYVNLNTALSGRRAKEMAMRRLLGSPRSAIFAKYIGESVLFTAVCCSLALLLAHALLPGFDRMLLNVSVDDQTNAWGYLPLQLQGSAGALAVYALGSVLVGMLVGLAPAVIALRYAPIDIVRGTFRRRTKMLFSKVFIVIQHAISVALIALSLVLELQMHHLLTKPLHGRTEGLYLLEMTISDSQSVEPLIDRLKRIPGVGRVGMGTGFPSCSYMSVYSKSAMDANIRIQSWSILCDEIYFELLGLEPVVDYNAPLTNSVWMSETLANELGLTDSLITFFPRFFQLNGACPEVVGGVYRDIPTKSADESDQLQSIAVIGRREDIRYANGLMIEVVGDRKATAEAIRNAYAAYSLEQDGIYLAPYRQGYLDNLIADRLHPIKMAMRLVELFMVLAVVISLLGLLAMSTYYARENTQSIAIRKVFGSNVLRELWRTVRNYMLLVLLSVLLGLPVAIWAADRYLEQFEYRIAGYGWIFAVAALIAVAIAFGSVLGQTLRAARTNPATELKKE